MLIKEYRIALPMSVEEYRIAQLYMIQKKSREESHGAGSGVEILINEPYEDGPGGSGQYTHKIYHIGSHLPSWFRAILPKSALRVEEKAWNAYPYTRTVYTCPFIEKFLLDIETRYLSDGGDTDNVFNLSEADKRNRLVDILDIVKDPIASSEYNVDEDPRAYCSEKTGRGPLSDSWRREYSEACRRHPPPTDKAIMCAYKLCKVEFKYWGMQSKIERFIHDIGLRKTMLRAHRQAWCWQDEYYGLTIDDIRELERETQLALQETMAAAGLDEQGNPLDPSTTKRDAITLPAQESVSAPIDNGMKPRSTGNDVSAGRAGEGRTGGEVNSVGHKGTGDELRLSGRSSMSSLGASRKQSWGSSSRSHKGVTAEDPERPINSWRMESLEKLQTSSSDEEEFFDATDEVFEANPDMSLYKSSSMELLTPDDDYQDTTSSADLPPDYHSVCAPSDKLETIYEARGKSRSISKSYFSSCVPSVTCLGLKCLSKREARPAQPHIKVVRSSSSSTPPPESHRQVKEVSPLDRRVEHYRQLQAMGGSHSFDQSLPSTPTPPTPSTLGPTVCKTTILFLVLHGGSIMDTGGEAQSSKHSDLSTFKSTLESTVRAHYPAVLGHIAVRLIPCPPICSDTLALLSSLNPYSFTAQSPMSADSPMVTTEALPIGAVSILTAGAPEYSDAVAAVIAKANSVYNEFLRSEDGISFNGQVCLIGDSVGSILGYDALCKNNPFIMSRANSRYGSHGSLADSEPADPAAASAAAAASGGGDQPVSADRPSVKRKTHLETIKQMSVSNPDLTTAGDVAAPPRGAGVTSSTTSTSASAGMSTEASGSEPTTAAAGAGAARRAHGAAGGGGGGRHASCPNSRRTSTGSTSDCGRFEFEVTDFFMFGSPLGLVLAYRKMCLAEDKSMYGQMQYLDPLAAVIGYNFRQQKYNDALPRPACSQMYNLFYPSDPSAIRMEPLLHERFKHVPPNKVARYQKFPLGDGQSIHVVETIQSHLTLLTSEQPVPSPGPSPADHPTLERRQSNMSIASQMSGHGDMLMANVSAITSRWWGNKRLDYALYCPDALQSFPTAALPYLLHASFWESFDVVAFILRQVVRQEYLMMEPDGTRDEKLFRPAQPCEKWLKRRTTIKLRNVNPNHRANDTIVLEDRPQVIPGRFMYGPLDMVSLSGERVDLHIMTKPPSGEWVFYGTRDTDSTGRVVFMVPEDKRLPQGMYPVKMVVRGDHTSVDSYLTVLPPRTECVVFSIDGSFTASVSIMGKDPKVRAGAVDVVRHWQELGFLILYISARPDMQQKKVVAWLAQHNFPHGMVSFMDGLSADPLRQKANYLKQLTNEAEIQIHCAYGSNKDLSVYQSVGISNQQIFIVGKASKKNQKEAQMISDGYAAHLTALSSHSLSRPAVGNARMFIRRSCFSLPGQQGKSTGKMKVRKTVSLPQRSSFREGKQETTICVSGSGNTVVDPSSTAGSTVRARGMSPRVKMAPYRYDSTNA